ncbi:MAG: hypothetical protein ACW98I_18790 [Candidatus Hodarchaeales archaeon]|jgi:hypothetical protein
MKGITPQEAIKRKVIKIETLYNDIMNADSITLTTSDKQIILTAEQKIYLIEGLLISFMRIGKEHHTWISKEDWFNNSELKDYFSWDSPE